MAFTGVAVVQKVSDRAVRITGLSLAGAASGTIGFSDKTVAAEVSIGMCPEWTPYELEGVVSLQDMVKVTFNLVTDTTTPVPIDVVKTGTTHLDFVITLHNGDDTEVASPVLEIYVEKLP